MQAPNGDLIAANGDAVNADPQNKQNSGSSNPHPGGKFVGQFSIDPMVNAPFGIALRISGHDLILAAVNDNQNTVELFRVHG